MIWLLGGSKPAEKLARSEREKKRKQALLDLTGSQDELDARAKLLSDVLDAHKKKPKDKEQ